MPLDPLAPHAATASTPIAPAPDTSEDAPVAGKPAATTGRPRPKPPATRGTDATNAAMDAQAAQAVQSAQTAALLAASLPGAATTPAVAALGTDSADAPTPRAGPAGAPQPLQGRAPLAAQVISPLVLVAPAPGTRDAPAPAAASAAPAAPGATAVSLAGPKAPASTSTGSAAADSAAAMLLTHGRDADSGDPNPDASAQPNDFAAAQAAAAPTASAEPAASAAPSVAVHTPMGASGWADEVGAQVIWMAHQGVSSASLRLHPEHLGPVEVKISVHEDNASVWFGASQPETRAALQQALPQLKDMFAAQGMTLTDAGVSREPPRDAQYAQRPAPAAAGTTTDSENATSLSVATRRRGLVDTYA
ncbi:MAG TPA: flagellar hook-length control protein FliK [Steroidobacteraceae bacterium]